jgi:hypothetical protein
MVAEMKTSQEGMEKRNLRSLEKICGTAKNK